jgi:hypothetical protein
VIAGCPVVPQADRLRMVNRQMERMRLRMRDPPMIALMIYDLRTILLHGRLC